MINGCVALRGAPADFAQWTALGANGWDWPDVAPYYERAEREVNIHTYSPARWQPIQTTFAAACVELGFRQAADLNAPDAWGEIIGSWPHNYRNGTRQGTLVTYLRRARLRPNLVIAPNAIVDRVLTEGGCATGISYLTSDGRGETVLCDRVVLSCGVYGSPSILLRSGIGPEEEVKAHGIRQVEALPVGEGLRDHPQCLFEFHVEKASADMTGPIGATAARGHGWFAFPLAVDEEAGVCAIAYALTGQEPIGSLRLASSDPKQAPLINHNFQSVIDRAMFDDAWTSFVELLANPSFRNVGARGGDLKRSLREILDERVGTAFHPTSTCAIGRVVDDHLAVIGIRGLWVADASVFPANVSTNTNLSCLMLGERAAELVRAGLDS